MSIKHHKLILRDSSPVTLWFGMLLASFAWLMHVTMLLTPLWDNNAHLGHGVCIKLAPIVSAAEQYERINHDIAHTAHNLPDDSAAFHFHHHPTPSAISAPAPVNPIATTHTKTSPKALHSKHHAESSDPDSIKHASCDICLSMTALLVPEVFTHTGSEWFEPSLVSGTFLYPSPIYYSTHFLRPLTRAPPPILFA